MEKIYCEAITEEGRQCSRVHKAQHNGYFYCNQHLLMWKRKSKSMSRIHDVEPWVQYQLPVPYESNPGRIMQKIRTRLKNGPKASEMRQPGHIYVYYLEGEEPNNYWKIGMTGRNVDKRLGEWEEELKGSLIILKASYALPRYTKFIEKLIHLYLSYCNIHRYPYVDAKSGQTRMHSLYSLPPNEILEDGQNMKDKSQRLNAMKKHVEWFKEDWDEVEKVVSVLCKVLPTHVWEKNVSPRSPFGSPTPSPRTSRGAAK